MTKEQKQVREFMRGIGQVTPDTPEIPSSPIQELRVRLHTEEAINELVEAFAKNDLVAIADSIADSLVVIYGTAVACGIDIEPIFQEVMKSNMTKLIDGYERPDGKWCKGPSYQPPNIEPLLLKQASL